MECMHEEYTVLKERGRQVTAKCLECGEIFTFIREKSIRVPIVINRRERSEKSSVIIPRDAMVRVGDIFDVDEEQIEVHSIEVGNKRVDAQMAEEINTLWGVSLIHPKVIGVSVHMPRGTISYKVKVDRDAVFRIGDVLQIGKIVFEISAMMTQTGKRKIAYGDDLKRLYGSPSNKIADMLLEVYDGV